MYKCMGKFTEEICAIRERKILLNREEKDLKARVMEAVKQEITPRLQKFYPSLDFNGYISAIEASCPQGGLSIGFEISPADEQIYEGINKDLKKLYEEIE